MSQHQTRLEVQNQSMTRERCGLMAPRQLRRLIGGLSFPESPRWHDGRLWLSDMGAGHVVAVSLDGAADIVALVPGTPSGLGWLPNGMPLVVSMEERSLFSIGPDGLTAYADLTDHVGGECNDMVIDGQGRAYVGNVGFD